jgi:hypothetical protein
MKNKLIIEIVFILAIFISLKTSAQNLNEDKFLGKWKWTSGNNEFTFYLKKDLITIDSPYYQTVIGFHTYKRNDTITQDFMPAFFPQYGTWQTASIIGGIMDDPNILLGSIADKETGMVGRLYLYYLFPSNQLRMEVRCEPCITKGDGKFKLPNGIILTKQP